MHERPLAHRVGVHRILRRVANEAGQHLRRFEGILPLRVSDGAQEKSDPAGGKKHERDVPWARGGHVYRPGGV